MYREIIKNQIAIEYHSRQSTSIEDCIDEGMSSYSYDIGINISFSINEDIIKKSLESKGYIK